jgi:hypothetical protein
MKELFRDYGLDRRDSDRRALRVISSPPPLAACSAIRVLTCLRVWSG